MGQSLSTRKKAFNLIEGEGGEMPNGTTCPYHEDRTIQLTEIEKKVATHEVEIENMRADTIVLFGKVEKAAEKNEAALDRLCGEVKSVKLLVGGVQSEQTRLSKAERETEAKIVENNKHLLDGEPVGYLNVMLRKAFTNPVLWALIGWALIKIFLFGEYPSFTAKTRPYMEPIMKSQIQLTEQHRIMHDQSIPHVHDEVGNPAEIVTEGRMPNTTLKAVTK
jgi:hypothetical protein